VKRGDRVFLRLPNIPEFYVAASAVPSDFGYQQEVISVQPVHIVLARQLRVLRPGNANVGQRH
jgi:hypothetical protein